MLISPYDWRKIMNVDDTPTPNPERPHDAPPEGPPTAPTQERPPQPRRLTRATNDRVLGGVAGGLGRYFSIDPIIPRIVFAALILAGGFGVLAYVAAWLFVPDEETGETVASSNRAAALAGIVVLVVAIGVLTGGPFLLFTGPGLFVIALAGAIGYALWRNIGVQGGGSVLARVVIVLVLGLLALAGMAAVTIGAALGGDAVIAGLVILAGLLVAAGAIFGRMRWLLLPAVLLAIPVGVVAAADLEVDGGIGEREYRPATVAELDEPFELGVGELRVDLRGLDLPPGRTPLDVELGIGRAVVLVDEDVCVAPDIEVGVGEADVLDRDSEGVDVRLDAEPAAAPGRPTLALTGDIGIGELLVVHDYSDAGFRDGPPWLEERGDRADRLAEACGTA
jgi:phage shock protein PspC (stress-responsive transcriptional regulator)